MSAFCSCGCLERVHHGRRPFSLHFVPRSAGPGRMRAEPYQLVEASPVSPRPRAGRFVLSIACSLESAPPGLQDGRPPAVRGGLPGSAETNVVWGPPRTAWDDRDTAGSTKGRAGWSTTTRFTRLHATPSCPHNRACVQVYEDHRRSARCWQNLREEPTWRCCFCAESHSRRHVVSNPI